MPWAAGLRRVAKVLMIDCTVDSSTMVDLLRGRSDVTSVLQPYAQIGLSHVAFGELLLGALKSTNSTELARTLTAVTGLTLLHGNEESAMIYAVIRRDLERNGTPIPHNDIWIAAAAIQFDVPLITRDHHFRQISHLQLVEY